MSELERRYGDRITVIGVHSPKYPAETVWENVAAAVARLGAHHPVVSDPDMVVWDGYTVNAWPTLVFISPEGRVIGRQVGEVSAEALSEAIDHLLPETESTGHPGNAQKPSPPTRLELRFPGKVLAEGERLFIADSGKHRIMWISTDGMVETVFGSGEAGWRDGAASEAQFRSPQGMALDATQEILYVADAGNHLIRAIDLRAGLVSTLAGTGTQAVRAIRAGAARDTPLSSPWDVALFDGSLYIAAAGLHQIWRINLETGISSVFAGTGHEAMRDGPRAQAWLAQPMGVAAFDGRLYFVCAETQALSYLDFGTEEVHTVVGGGLFEFGDRDGAANEALLQHPQGIAANSTGVYIADTYNNKIKRWDPDLRQILTVAGSGVASLLDGPGAGARFWAPSGLSASGDVLYVSDTNNHAVRTVDVNSGHVRTLTLRANREIERDRDWWGSV